MFARKKFSQITVSDDKLLKKEKGRRLQRVEKSFAPWGKRFGTSCYNFQFSDKLKTVANCAPNKLYSLYRVGYFNLAANVFQKIVTGTCAFRNSMRKFAGSCHVSKKFGMSYLCQAENS